MSVTSVDSTVNTNTTTTNLSSSTENEGTVTMDDFLTLFVEELKNQDPLEPMNNSEYITQLAQISLLEQISNLNNKMDRLVEIETDTNEQIKKSYNSLSTYSELIGKSAYWSDIDGSELSGMVEGIIQKEFKYYAIVNGEEINIESISRLYDGGSNDVDTNI